MAVLGGAVDDRTTRVVASWTGYSGRGRREDGALRPSETPGLGVGHDVDLGEKYEYEPSYLPVNRLADGTVHDW